MQLEALETLGYVVLPTQFDSAQLTDEFMKTLREFPAFLPGATSFVGGGFSALGNSQSFHNPFVRELRSQLCQRFGQHLKQQLGFPYLQVLPDRMLYRPVGAKVTQESWHRDVAPGLPSDLVLGGWINCGQSTEQFICVPGTRLDESNKKTENGGFYSLKKSDFADYNARKTVVQIPPGHVLLFDETIIHCVAASKHKVPLCRLFLAWRLTHSQEPLLPQLESQLLEQAVVTLKSEQEPRMWPKLWWVNWKSHLVRFTQENIRPEYRETIQGIQRCVLYLLEPPVSQPYSLEELSIYKPH